MSFDFATLITDRQKSDADYARALIGRITDGTATAEELAAWNAATLKGVYDYTDLNRVTAAMDEINSQLSVAGYRTGYQPVKTNNPNTGKLPKGYTELLYIESNGSQSLDTQVKARSDLIIKFGFEVFETVGSAILGYYNSEEDSFRIFNNDSANHCFLDFGGTPNRIIGGSLAVNTLHSVEIGNRYVKNLVTGDTIVSSSPISAFEKSTNIFICGNNTDKRYAKGRFYYLKIDGLRDYIPCKNPDGIAGMYDLVTKTFYRSFSGVDFIAGPEAQVINPENIILLLHGDEIADSSIYQKTITNSGVMVSELQSKFGEKSLFFNGNSYLTVDLPVNGDVTVDFWLFHSGGSMDYPTPLAYRVSDSVRGIYLVIQESDDQLVYGASSASSGFNEMFSGTITNNQWTHFAAVRKSGTITFYKNGVQVAQFDGVLTSNQKLMIGWSGDNANNYFNGYIEEFRVCNLAVWDSNFIPANSMYEIKDKAYYIWTESDSPTLTQLTQYLDNVRILRSEIANQSPDVPGVKDMFSVEAANNIEKILMTIDRSIQTMKQTYVPCGATACGGDYL